MTEPQPRGRAEESPASFPDESIWEPGRRRRYLRLPVTLLLLGLLAISVLIGFDRLRQRLTAGTAQRALALKDIRAQVATSDIWLQDYLAGGEVDWGDIFNPIDDALGSALALSADTGAEPSTPQELALIDQLKRCKQLAERRIETYAAGQGVGDDPILSSQYKQVLREVLAQLRQLEHALESRLESSQRASDLYFWGSVGALSTAVGLAIFGLWHRQHRRWRIENALEMSQAQLLQAQKMEAVGRLAGGLAHDINNYLAAIRGHCELARMKRHLPERVEAKMDSAILGIEKASSLIERLLAFSRKQPIEPQVVDLNQVVEGLEKIMARLIGEHIRLETRLAENLWQVEIDPAQVEQVIVNLLVNSRDAMPEGGTIRLETENRRLTSADIGRPDCLETEYVYLSAADTGKGMPPEILDKVFEPFFTTKERAGSSGLGLSTVYGIVQQNGGWIELASEVGRGTVFHLYLPRCRRPGQPQAGPSGAALEPELGGSEKILLVDDNASFRYSIQALLEELGYRVLAASQADEALALFGGEAADADLVISDIVMPGMSGIELLRQMRRQRPVRALLISGYSDSLPAGYTPRGGSDEWLKKPFSPRDLARRIRSLLDAPDSAVS